MTPVPKPTWGAKPFTVEAEASDGSPISYSAEGSCSVGEDSGRVTVETLGPCTITADAPEAVPPARALLDFEVTKAKPVISFGDASTRFARPFKYPLKVSVTPDIPLKMVVDLDDPQGNNDEFCTIKGGALVFNKTPTADDFPQIPAVCVVRISGTATENYDAPKPVSRKVTINLAAFNVNAQEVINVKYDPDNPVVTFTVRERSGDAFGIQVSSESFECNPLPTTPEEAPAGTTVYKATVELQEPPDNAPYKCDMKAQAVPPDYQGGKFEDDFTISVVP